MNEQKAMLAKLRQTFRAIASAQGIESPLWEYVSAIDSMMETGKCELADTIDALIEICVTELEGYINAQQS